MGSWVGIIAFYLRGGDTLIQHATLRLLLSASWRLHSFLDHCVNLGVLRRIGTAHVFRHYSFQEHLASPVGRS